MANGTGDTTTTETYSASRVEQFNQMVRSIVTLSLTFGFVWGFLVSTTITSEMFGTVFAGVIGYWFASRDARSRTSDAPTTTTTTTPSETKIITTPTPPAGG